MKPAPKALISVLTVLFFLALIPGALHAQNTHRDSVKRAEFARDSIKQDSLAGIIRVKRKAGIDGWRQRLNLTQTQLFIANKKNGTSDLFKPQMQFVSDTTLLSDSVYTKAFRLSAYQRAVYDNSHILKCYWGSFAIGASSTGGVCLNLNGNAELPHQQLITLDAQAEVSTGLFAPYDDVAAASVLYGHVLKDKNALYTISGGLGIVNVQTATGGFLFNSTTNTTSVCVPIVIRGYYVLGQAFGLGLGVYLNLNSIQTTAGVNVSFAFGRLTTHERDANYKPRQRPRLFGSI